jgi:hypothetical protein
MNTQADETVYCHPYDKIDSKAHSAYFAPEGYSFVRVDAQEKSEQGEFKGD